MQKTTSGVIKFKSEQFVGQRTVKRIFNAGIYNSVCVIAHEKAQFSLFALAISIVAAQLFDLTVISETSLAMAIFQPIILRKGQKVCFNWFAARPRNVDFFYFTSLIVSQIRLKINGRCSQNFRAKPLDVICHIWSSFGPQLIFHHQTQLSNFPKTH